MTRYSTGATVVATGLCMATSASLLLGAGLDAGSGPDTAEAVRRFVKGGPPMVRSYEARRVLEATAQNGKLQATLEADVKFENGRFSYEIVSERGSAILQTYVLQRALDEERRTINEGRTGEAALSSANYRFTPGGVDAQGLVRIGITPHAPAAMLLDGQVRVDSAGELVAVEGRLSQSPSFWTLQVDIERHYSQVAGVRVPDVMRSRAQVRVAGTGTFEMRYFYRQINGRTVGAAPRAEPIAPIQRGPHIIPANHVRGEPYLRKLS